jgi:hypothetical protein
MGARAQIHGVLRDRRVSAHTRNKYAATRASAVSGAPRAGAARNHGTMGLPENLLRFVYELWGKWWCPPLTLGPERWSTRSV